MRGALLVPVARWPALAGIFCGVGTSRGGRQKAHHGRTPFSATQSPLALRVASCMPAHARGIITVARQARNVLPAADGPCHPRSVELDPNAQTLASLAQKWTR